MTTDSDMLNWGMNTGHQAMIERFRLENGRSPRVLAIGNIANNAFKNAKILNDIGVECHVMCHDYYHVMGCPEWEMARFVTDGINFDAPNWSSIDLAGYTRPKWFVQGRLFTAIDYLIAYNEGSDQADVKWRVLAAERDAGGALMEGSSKAAVGVTEIAYAIADRLSALYSVIFADRYNKLSPSNVIDQYLSILLEHERFRRLLSFYDCVIGYSTDGMFPLMFGKRPYVCFEHGTIRTFPFEDSVFGKMCALSYACADDVLISNCDNVVAARKLRLESFRFTPHPMLDESGDCADHFALRQSLLETHKADFIIFHPSRQHWSNSHDLNWEKGNDQLIRGFARFLTESRPAALLVMVEWGQTVEASKALIDSLGIASRVVWIYAQTLPVVGQYVAAADVLADQFVIGAWGAVMPHGMMMGTPTLIYLDETLHRWCFPQMPPVLNVRTSDEICAALLQSTDPDYRAQIKKSGPEWFERYHSQDVVAGRLLDSLTKVLSNEQRRNLGHELREMRAEIEQIKIAAGQSRWSSGISSMSQAFGFGELGRSASRMSGLKLQFLRLREKHPVFGGILFNAVRWPYRGMRALMRSFQK